MTSSSLCSRPRPLTPESSVCTFMDCDHVGEEDDVVSTTVVEAGVLLFGPTTGAFEWLGVTGAFEWLGVTGAFEWLGVTGAFEWLGVTGAFEWLGVMGAFEWLGVTGAFE
ncbi:MAG: hypothetical protein JSS34_01940 [Proteobacteria bacterium]|nr:hypothetical protein [Pseudomonadota bacterium]